MVCSCVRVWKMSDMLERMVLDERFGKKIRARSCRIILSLSFKACEKLPNFGGDARERMMCGTRTE